MKTWRGLQALYGTKIVKSALAPAGNPNILWIKTGGSLDVAHSWDVLLKKWIPLNGSITWVMYADDINGTNMSLDSTDKTYIGIAFNQSEEEPALTPEVYTWSLFKGNTGVQGPTGDNGSPTYTWIKYGEDVNGLNMSDSPINKAYLGLAHNKLTTFEGSNPKDYTWTLIKGDRGAEGKTSYIHIAYSTSLDGTTGFSTTVSEGKSYMGQYADFEEVDSEDPSLYSWTHIKGEKGDTGEDAWHVEILSSNGNIFKESNIHTVLDARVYKGGTDVTNDIPASKFKWKRVSEDMDGDMIWNDRYFGGTKTIMVTPEDVYRRATFFCEVIE